MSQTRIAFSRRMNVVLPRFTLTICLSACLSAAPPRTEERPDRNVLVAAELVDQHYTTAYDAIEALRSNWLQARGPDSFTNPSVVLVYLDNVKLGTVETLRTLDPKILNRIEHFDGVSATARWGAGHSAGVILATALGKRPRGLRPSYLGPP